jgi:hypothetical protein
MDRLSSVEFRKSYAKLTEPTDVTVNGHVIGRWVPVGSPVTIATGRDGSVVFDPPPMRDQPVRVLHPGGRVEDRPFTPVPKPNQKASR